MTLRNLLPLVAAVLWSSGMLAQTIVAGPTIQLPPISWSCPMHPDVVDDHKGSCPICKMDLQPVRLVTVYTCPVHAVIEQSQPGKCRICSRDLIQTTKAMTFTCAGHPEVSQIEPGRCADGTAMTPKYAARPHGDHNPRHGGQFSMADDNWHHVEGTYPSRGVFRVYLYDDYTKPLPLAAARKVRARVVMKEIFDPATNTTRELSSAALVLARNGAYLQARIDPQTLPAKMTAKMSFGADDKESRFDFVFPSLSKDVAVPAASTSQTAPKQSQPPVDRSGSATSLAGGMVSQAATQSEGVAPRPTIDSSAPTAALLQDMKDKNDELAGYIKDGNWGFIYVPALQVKDLALEIQSRQTAAPAAEKQAIEAQVKQIVLAAYELDNYGDLGDAVKINSAYEKFTKAVSALTTLVTPRR